MSVQVAAVLVVRSSAGLFDSFITIASLATDPTMHHILASDAMILQGGPAGIRQERAAGRLWPGRLVAGICRPEWASQHEPDHHPMVGVAGSGSSAIQAVSML